jgi:hypothetical protein
MSEDQRVDPQLLTALTTEHFVLQTARGSTIGEANGRASIYLGALSSALIALGFVADQPGTFRVFAAVVLPAVLLLGWFTFVRMVQTSVENVLYLTRIQRIRRWYAQLATDAAWFADVARPPGDEAAAALTTTGMRPGRLQMLFTAAAMVAALNSIVLGTAICLLLRAVEAAPLAAAVVTGAALGAAALLGQLAIQRRQLALHIGE